MVVVLAALVGTFFMFVIQFVPFMSRDIVGSTAHVLDWLYNQTDTEYRK